MLACLRLLLRLLGIIALLGLAVASYWLATNGKSEARLPIARARWLRRNSQRLLVLMGVRVHGTLSAPPGSLVVSNHLSYLDVLVLAACQPMVFVSKAEVRSWPVVGWFVRHAGTVFLEREQRAGVAPALAAMTAVLDRGIPVALFPEGTNSNGTAVAPFHSSLLAPAEQGARPLVTVALRYRAPGTTPDRLSYWNDDTFLPHFLRMLWLPHIDAHLATEVLGPVPASRKQIRTDLHQGVSRLLAGLGA